MNDSTAVCSCFFARTRATSSVARQHEVAFGGGQLGLRDQFVDRFGFVARIRGGEARTRRIGRRRKFGGEDRVHLHQNRDG
jgi:hypothetical protein